MNKEADESSKDKVMFYEREYYIFSNFSSFKVEWKDRLWMTSEHAFQAARFFDIDESVVEEIFNARSAHDAKKIAYSHADKISDSHTDWHIEIMEEICWNKLQQHSYIQKKILETEEKEIIENSPRDDFWGWGPNKDGRNELGKVWMRLRERWKR